MKKLTKKDIEKYANMIRRVHEVIIEHSGGHSKEVRDEGCLFHSAYKIKKYLMKTKNPYKVGAYVYCEIAPKQIFFDGNKRTAHMMATIHMLERGLYLEPFYKDAVKFIIKIADNEKTKKEVEQWIEENSKVVKVNAKKDLKRYLSKWIEDMTIGDKNAKK